MNQFKANSSSEIIYVNIADKLIKKYCIHDFCIQFTVALEAVNPKFDVQVASKKKISSRNALFSSRTHLCAFYNRYQGKTSSLLEKSFSSMIKNISFQTAF